MFVRRTTVALQDFGGNVRPSGSNGTLAGSYTVHEIAPTNRTMCPLGRRVNTPTRPYITIKSDILINRTVTRPNNFISTTVYATISNAIGTVSGQANLGNHTTLSVIVSGSKTCAPIPALNRPRSPTGLSTRSVLKVVQSTNVINRNNTNFPARMGLSVGPNIRPSAIVVGTTRYRPCLASSCHLLVRRATRFIRNIHVLLRLFPRTQTIINVRSGGPTTVSLLQGTLTRRTHVTVRPLGAGCLRNNRHVLVRTIANQSVGSERLPVSTNYIIIGMSAI